MSHTSDPAGHPAVDTMPPATDPATTAPPPTADGSAASDGPPAPDEQLACPMCAYSLRGLPDPRCPECGYAFTWRELRAALRGRHSYLFEHHPDRPVWAFRRTVLASQTPTRFWTTLTAGHRIDQRRVVVYVLVGMVFHVTLTAAVFCSLMLAALTWWAPRFLPMSLTEIAVELALEYVLPVAVHVVSWPVFMWLGLQVFLWTMIRMNIPPAHVTRCVAYSWDALLAGAGVGYVIAVVQIILGGHPVTALNSISFATFLATPVALYRIGVAYRRYMRFPHAWATVVAAQVMAGLGYLVVLQQLGYL